MKKLAPTILRQRMVIELLTPVEVTQPMLFAYLKELTGVSCMKPLRDPEISPAGDIGIGAWQHWITSGCHVYSYDKKYTATDSTLVTIDTYTCKAFDPTEIVEFTRAFFDALEIEWKEV